ncbi:MAG TPA: hypothetical protein VK672_05665 [Solirubrobacteraceae bacterium]|jgi:hypothetical protein|nr:hypothetical protein [Solirubrobacteraceae bacterium]
MPERSRRLRISKAVGSPRKGIGRAAGRARLAIVLQRIAPDLAAPLWRVRTLRELPLKVRGQIANVLGCEPAANGLDDDEEPNAYGRELGELFDALGL